MSNQYKELLPCPFCGSEEVKIAAHPGAGTGYLHRGDTVYSIDCMGCTASFASRYKRQLLVEQWNRRAINAELEQAKADAERWQRWLPWLRGLNKVPFDLAMEISRIDAYNSQEVKS